MDFALILVVATLATGLIWAFDALVWQRSRLASAARGVQVREPVVVEYAKSFFPILLLVLVIRSFLFEPFRIPSGSMMPTLLEGDFIFVNKFAYGLRLPVINTKIVDIGEPQRGDVVVFKLPSDPEINYIKRVVGLPGDIVNYQPGSKQLTINGEPIPMDLLGEYDGDPGVELAREELGEHDHRLLLTRGRLSPGGTYPVPEGHYFMMGDNRDNSRDSRFPGVEFIPEYRLVGRAVRIWMNWRWPAQGGPQWSRIGKGIE
ncbi:MAG TPA: signal peptidase I [Gammaproteobacteria bacterium]|nr:signal peptidase I [Gammaproteobacteria bacterium]